LIAGANNIKMAFTVAEEIEFCAQIYYQTKSVGEPLKIALLRVFFMLS
ncbi:fuculose phosphate aldolase, partial [Bacillus toyonensis]